MPTKKRNDTPEEQGARFRAEVERMIAAGELSPTDAEGVFERLLAAMRSQNESRRPDGAA